MPLPTITIHAGAHHRQWCPIEFQLPEPIAAGTYLLAGDDGATLLAQAGDEGVVRFVLPDLEPGASRVYRLENGLATAGEPDVALTDSGGVLAIALRGELVTSYVHAGVPARPYFYPVNAPGQISVTRAFPMEDVPGEMRDHPHHKSLWIAHGEVNGADNWSEEAGHGFTRHEAFEHVSSGPVAGSFASRSLWTRADGAPLLTQRLVVTVWATDGDYRLLDFDIRLEATHGDVHFGDTKEGGISCPCA